MIDCGSRPHDRRFARRVLLDFAVVLTQDATVRYIECNIFILATYTMIKIRENKKKLQTPLKLRRFAARGEV